MGKAGKKLISPVKRAAQMVHSSTGMMSADTERLLHPRGHG